MNDQNVDKLVEQAQQNWQDITHGNPNGKEWGFFSYGDAPAGMGGGMGTNWAVLFLILVCEITI